MSDRVSPAEVPPGVPAPGEIFADKYRIDGVLGIGGMGAVLAAHHLHLDEKVAIKVMLPSIAQDGTTSVRFLREARAAVKIKSEHVAKVTDFGQLPSGQAYMVMEYLVGEDLGAALDRRRSLPVAETVEVLLQASEAIAQAHAMGIVHRDLKPGNLFLTTRDDGTRCVKVLDFGISKGTTQDGSVQSLTLTKTQGLVGSPMYMAPEQMRTNQPLDARTDIWSLGVVAYELLTGRVPFEAKSMAELAAMVLQDEPPTMDRREVPIELEQVIRRCLAKKPVDRYADVAALAAALAPFGANGAEELALRVARARRSRADDGNRSGRLPSIPSSPSFDPQAVTRIARSDQDRGPTLDARTAGAWTGAQPTPRLSRRRMARVAGVGFAGLAAVVGVVAWRVLAPSGGANDVAAAPTGSPAESAPAPPPPSTPAPAESSAGEPTAPAARASATSAQEAGASKHPAAHRAQSETPPAKKVVVPAATTTAAPPHASSVEEERKN